MIALICWWVHKPDAQIVLRLGVGGAAATDPVATGGMPAFPFTVHALSEPYIASELPMAYAHGVGRLRLQHSADFVCDVLDRLPGSSWTIQRLSFTMCHITDPARPLGEYYVKSLVSLYVWVGPD